MVTCLGHSVPELADAAATQAEEIAYFYNHHFTSDTQERLADRVLEVVAPEMARVRFVSGGSEAVETALQLARLYHVDRGDEARWRVISPAQAYHGSTMGTLALNGRPHLKEPNTPYLAEHLHIPPSTWRFDPSGRAALDELDRHLDASGGEIAAFLCEPISAAALPAYSPPDAFWEGVGQRREEHGFLVIFDEVVTGVGRTGTWLAAHQVPLQPDIVAVGKGLGAGHAPLAAVLCRQHVYDAIDAGSREFDLGTRGTALRSLAVGNAVLDLMVERAWSTASGSAGPSLLEELTDAVGELPIVREVRGRGFLLGVELVDPRDGSSFLPVEMDAAASSTTPRSSTAARHLDPSAGGRVRRRPGAARARLHEHRRGARRDGRPVRGDDRGRQARDRAALAGPRSVSARGGVRPARDPRRERVDARARRCARTRSSRRSSTAR
jgi:adenosylmethionine-8-amino-7-oxononanoate aminotransferase